MPCTFSGILQSVRLAEMGVRVRSRPASLRLSALPVIMQDWHSEMLHLNQWTPPLQKVYSLGSRSRLTASSRATNSTFATAILTTVGSLHPAYNSLSNAAATPTESHSRLEASYHRLPPKGTNPHPQTASSTLPLLRAPSFLVVASLPLSPFASLPRSI